MDKKNWGIIATWRMAFDGITEGATMLQDNKSATDAVLTAVTRVEDYPYYKSVGYGGLPNEKGVVELDAAFMDGTTMALGAIASVKDVANPILVAEKLSRERFNSFMVGEGAEQWAFEQGFEKKEMLTERAQQHYIKRCRETLYRGLSPYTGHDTVGIAALDLDGNISVGTSTSGLFMKRPGRVGDSPVSGSGYYADSEIGAATATGLGEDLMKGCISYEIVRRMGEGMTPQQAADSTVNDLEKKLIARYGRAGDLSVVCINKDGDFGAATNIDSFSFSVETSKHPATIYVCERRGSETHYSPASQEWLDAYQTRITAPIE
ncbi:N(4)-(beta-N-acetylglucosaminyl)-L-asparaginase [Enterovibrio sp. ZSDZ35]|uniref:N(4)-(Beta-N-acetylglucosaminyl)-L-asparaginase n=1 Tax=Enterovibrio qingdaonensis TaxID=2899818 RepID=A0ABT5QJ98_9GAMM|nr:N(4)-(beta-N-acetylglucosaminyl)-L-asparaginase [Enterovibrio sp. ZSDZ35]MDD1781067.1 N(4)-(beta-N-acetylglucosaminyl)-L-asparaginase [Enterovibrio sp. ZSDZ35]